MLNFKDPSLALAILGIVLAILFYVTSPIVQYYFERAMKRRSNRTKGSKTQEGNRNTETTEMQPPLVADTIGLKLKLEGKKTANQRLKYLVDQNEEVRKNLDEPDYLRTTEIKDVQERCQIIEFALRNMWFLREKDNIDKRFVLIEKIGEGNISQIWKAWDEERAIWVALRFLRYPFYKDSLIQQRFFNGAKIMSQYPHQNIPKIYEEKNVINGDEQGKILYYVMEYVEGATIKEKVENGLVSKNELVGKLLEVGHCLEYFHKKGIIHRDIKPSNIMIDTSGTPKLIDLDSVSIEESPCHSMPGVGTFGFSGPEVLGGKASHDQRSDVFSLARVFVYVLLGRPLPDPYDIGNYDLVFARLNCGFMTKEILNVALFSSQTHRCGTMEMFLKSMRTALEYDLHETTVREIFVQYRHRFYEILRHAFHGTLAFMIVFRPILASGNLVHLSHNAGVGFLHAFLGSYVWTILIAGTFLIYRIAVFKFSGEFWNIKHAGAGGYIFSSCACGIAGLLGGIIVALPGALVTHENTLYARGWIETDVGLQLTKLKDFAKVSGVVESEELETLVKELEKLIPSTKAIAESEELAKLRHYSKSGGDVAFAKLKPIVKKLEELMRGSEQIKPMDKLSNSLKQTYMFLAFPFTGTLTGIGLGLFLNRKFNELERLGVDGLLPIPEKFLRSQEGVIEKSIRFIFRDPSYLLLLFLPALGGIFAHFLLGGPTPGVHDSNVPFVNEIELYTVFLPSVGEGFVHFLGAIGLCIGFFLGVPTKVFKGVNNDNAERN